jgi:hypothetical protein
MFPLKNLRYILSIRWAETKIICDFIARNNSQLHIVFCIYYRHIIEETTDTQNQAVTPCSVYFMSVFHYWNSLLD